MSGAQWVYPGDRVTWNDQGKQLFGDTGSTGLLVAVEYDRPGFTGPCGHILWESGQETWASLDCLSVAGSSR